LGGEHKVAPGDTIWLRGGTYKWPNREANSQGYPVKLAGEGGRPIQVRPYKRERVTIDGGLSVVAPCTDLWISDLEIIVSENLTQSRTITEKGSNPKEIARPLGGLTVTAGRGCKYINLVIHDSLAGIGFWQGATDSEVYGCLIYNNGWLAPDRGHGHCIYTQNKDGVKTIANCIMSCPYPGSFTMHAYGSKRAFVDNFLIENNVCYEQGRFLVGGGSPSHHIRVFSNYLYKVGMQLGYGAENEDCEVRDNVVFQGDLAIVKFKTSINEHNTVILTLEKAPTEPTVTLWPNRYDPDRAHLVIFNWQKAKEVRVPSSPFLKKGDSYRLMDPKNLYGKPLFAGKCKSDSLRIPMKDEFAVFVVLKAG
jgi:hypothetical protein